MDAHYSKVIHAIKLHLASALLHGGTYLVSSGGNMSVPAVKVSIISCWLWGVDVCTCCAVVVAKPMSCKYGSVFWDENAQLFLVPESANPQLHHANITQESIPSCRSSPVCLGGYCPNICALGIPTHPIFCNTKIRPPEAKAILRVRSQLTNLQRCLEEALAPASFSSMELQLSTLVIAFAILNPLEDVTEWDIDRFAEPKRNVEDKTKYFPYPQWGLISDPATILDVHSRVVVWYLPGIMSPARVVILSLPPPSILY
ncbi:hypothetical protein EDD17DRAFT_1503854 [Pisolithus thermaeus]|nr:hypothetical protein EV401DRAFT_1896434 [Pisolithus croceorrhizus]KAI6167572.1 hypothetical protein EDD17DRAFT_1503854 [Pisolithus thermaeus]